METCVPPCCFKPLNLLLRVICTVSLQGKANFLLLCELTNHCVQQASPNPMEKDLNV